MTDTPSDEELVQWGCNLRKTIGKVGVQTYVKCVDQMTDRLSALLRERDSAIAERDRMRSALENIQPIKIDSDYYIGIVSPNPKRGFWSAKMEPEGHGILAEWHEQRDAALQKEKDND